MTDQTGSRKLKLEIDRSAHPIVIVRCHGRLVTGENDHLHTTVRGLIPAHKRIILDLTGITIMDSTGLGTMVRLYVTARSAGSSLELINLGPRIRELLGVTNLLSVFTIIGENNIRMP